MTATVDCVALKAEYDALQASYLQAIQGKRVVSNTYMDMTTSFAQVGLKALKDERDAMAATLQSCCGITVRAEVPRMLAPAISNGRCAR